MFLAALFNDCYHNFLIKHTENKYNSIILYMRLLFNVFQIKTNQGRGRAFLRFALVHHRLADTLQHCVYNTKVTR